MLCCSNHSNDQSFDNDGSMMCMFFGLYYFVKLYAAFSYAREKYFAFSAFSFPFFGTVKNVCRIRYDTGDRGQHKQPAG